MDAHDDDGTRICEAMGVAPTMTNRQQALALRAALRVFERRNAEHRDLWAHFDISDPTHQAFHKAARLKAAVSRGADDEDFLSDTILDGINYFAFALRYVTGDLPL